VVWGDANRICWATNDFWGRGSVDSVKQPSVGSVVWLQIGSKCCVQATRGRNRGVFMGVIQGIRGGFILA
jgi:uncharacterized membrane protein YeiH